MNAHPVWAAVGCEVALVKGSTVRLVKVIRHTPTQVVAEKGLRFRVHHGELELIGDRSDWHPTRIYPVDSPHVLDLLHQRRWRAACDRLMTATAALPSNPTQTALEAATQALQALSDLLRSEAAE